AEKGSRRAVSLFGGFYPRSRLSAVPVVFMLGPVLFVTALLLLWRRTLLRSRANFRPPLGLCAVLRLRPLAARLLWLGPVFRLPVLWLLWLPGLLRRVGPVLRLLLALLRRVGPVG